MKPCSLLRRLMVIIYDLLLLISFVFTMALIYRLIFGAHRIDANNIAFIYYQIYLLIIIVFYFCFPWVKSGQTLAMKVWRVKVVNDDLSTITYQQAFLRFVYALLSWLLLGVGFFYALGNQKRHTLYDRWSNSYLVEVKKSVK